MSPQFQISFFIESKYFSISTLRVFHVQIMFYQQIFLAYSERAISIFPKAFVIYFNELSLLGIKFTQVFKLH